LEWTGLAGSHDGCALKQVLQIVIAVFIKPANRGFLLRPHEDLHMRRILNQAANAAVKHKGSIFEILYRRYVPRLGHNQAIGIIAHKLCRLVWKISHRGIRYEERGQEVSKASKQKRTRKMIQALRRLGDRIEPNPSQSAIPASHNW
jgi:hypothetical protein